MIEIESGHYYYFDLNKINDWIFNNQSDINFIETKEYTYTKENGGIGTEISHNENNTSKQMYSNTRFELLTDMLNSLFTLTSESDNNGVKFIQNTEDLGIGNKIIFNTLIENEFVVDKLGSKKKK